MPRFVPDIDARETIARMQALTGERGRRITRTEFSAATGVTNFQMIREFGGYNGLLRAAGFPAYVANQRMSDDDMLRTLRDCCLQAGHVVSQTEFDRVCTKGGGHGRHKPYHRRWGRWPGVLAALRVWVAANDPGFPHRDGLPDPSVVPDPRPERPVPSRRYGAPFSFPGFLHEPVNEQGVVLLFGAVAREFGFAIEHVSGAFPDCEAKRRRGDIWERVRIEFEYQCRNFLVHRHDALQCDLIVCWENDWKECPVEVMELKAELPKLKVSP